MFLILYICFERITLFLKAVSFWGPYINIFIHKITKCELDIKSDLGYGGYGLGLSASITPGILLICERIKCSSLRLCYLKLGYTVQNYKSYQGHLQILKRWIHSWWLGSICYDTIRLPNASLFFFFFLLIFFLYHIFDGIPPASVSLRCLYGSLLNVRDLYHVLLHFYGTFGIGLWV